MRAASSTKVILFVHGLGSNARDTWEPLFNIFIEDPAFDEYTLACYEYPTSKHRGPLASPSISLLDLASGLKTELTERYKDAEVTLVAHSMGGLVVRQFLTASVASGNKAPVARAFLYAVPNRGAPIAAAANTLSANNRHLELLRSDDEILRRLNEDWVTHSVENVVNIRHAVAGKDEVVPVASALPIVSKDYAFLPSYSHGEIVRPTEPDDIRYVVLKNFIQPVLAAQEPSAQVQIRTDPLFDVYTTSNETFYITRAIDMALSALVAVGHGWAEGPTGTGKTAALTRCIKRLPWKMVQIMLASYGRIGPVGLLWAMCAEFADLCGTVAPPRSSDPSELIKAFRSIARESPGQIIGILVEEIPLRPEEFGDFAALMLTLAQSLDADEGTNGRILLFFSSVDTVASGPHCGPKFRERFTVLTFDRWADEDIRRLVDLLAAEIRPSLSEADRQDIVASAGGSARFIKSLFRRWRNATDAGLGLEQLLAQIQMEQSS